MPWPNRPSVYKTKLIARRRIADDVELARLTYLDWFNQRRLHSSIGDVPAGRVRGRLGAVRAHRWHRPGKHEPYKPISAPRERSGRGGGEAIEAAFVGPTSGGAESTPALMAVPRAGGEEVLSTTINPGGRGKEPKPEASNQTQGGSSRCASRITSVSHACRIERTEGGRDRQW